MQRYKYLRKYLSSILILRFKRGYGIGSCITSIIFKDIVEKSDTSKGRYIQHLPLSILLLFIKKNLYFFSFFGLHFGISTMCVQCLEVRRRHRIPDTAVTVSCESPCGWWELNPGPLKEQSRALNSWAVSPTTSLSIFQMVFMFCKLSCLFRNEHTLPFKLKTNPEYFIWKQLYFYKVLLLVPSALWNPTPLFNLAAEKDSDLRLSSFWSACYFHLFKFWPYEVRL